jgi:hypothetical protein
MNRRLLRGTLTWALIFLAMFAFVNLLPQYRIIVDVGCGSIIALYLQRQWLGWIFRR